MVNWFLTKIPSQFNGEKDFFATNDCEAIGNLQEEDEFRIMLRTVLKKKTKHGENPLKLNHRPKCKNKIINLLMKT